MSERVVLPCRRLVREAYAGFIASKDQSTAGALVYAGKPSALRTKLVSSDNRGQLVMDDTHKLLPAQMRSAVDIERAFGLDNALIRALDDMRLPQDVLSAVYGPAEELRRAGTLAALTKESAAFNAFAEQSAALNAFAEQNAALNAFAEQRAVVNAFAEQNADLVRFAEQRDAIAELQRQLTLSTEHFKLPDVAAAAQLMEAYRTEHASELVKHFRENHDYLRHAAESIRSPWLNMQSQMRSIGAFAEIQSVGFALRNVPAFDDRFTALLRIDLGDWQDQLMFPNEIFYDPIARSVFYQERGFDRALASFPTDTFNQNLDIAGLRGEPTPIVEAYNYEETEENGEQEAAFARTNAAHDRLQRFETQLRQFIDAEMTRACGEQWIKHRVPGPMRERWTEKRQNARERGEADHPLIAYADFTDYVPIITQRNNWTEIFQAVFHRPASVQESFQRLYPIRVCTMHARMITQDDEIYLYVEIKRILSAIGVP